MFLQITNTFKKTLPQIHEIRRNQLMTVIRLVGLRRHRVMADRIACLKL